MGSLRLEPPRPARRARAARRRPALTAARCPAPGAAEVRWPAERFQDVIAEYHILLPMGALDEYQGGPSSLHDPGEDGGK